MTILKLKPIAEQVLQEAGETVTWGDVRKFLNDLIDVNKKKALGGNVKSIAAGVGKTAVKGWIKGVFNTATAGTLDALLAVVDEYGEDVGKFLLNLGKNVSQAELKKPEDSKFKEMTGAFWDKVKLSATVSEMLDDKIEYEFINQVLVPELSKPGSDSQPIPNMDELLGKWLNDKKGIKQTASIHFKSKEGEL
jgi:hypothetical protein